MIRKVKCDKCGKHFTAEIDHDTEREVKPQMLCCRCYSLSLPRPEPQAAPDWEDLTAIIRPMIESVCSDSNSDAARLAKDIAARIIASCSLTRPKEK